MPYNVFTVLKSGGDFLPAHVSAFKRQLDLHAPAATLYCLTDIPGEITAEGVNCIQLEHNWPGWWSKMELFRPDIDHPDMLYFDLDTMIVGDIEPLLEEDRFLMLRDWLRPHGLNSSVMSLPVRQRKLTWSHWEHRAADFIAKYSSPAGDTWGDQAVLETLWLYEALRWQDAHPGMLCSYKAHNVGRDGVPTASSVVCFHGRPRPWDTDLWTDVPEELEA